MLETESQFLCKNISKDGKTTTPPKAKLNPNINNSKTIIYKSSTVMYNHCMEQLVIHELNRLSDEYHDRDELERNIEFCSNLQEQKSNLLSDIAVYEKAAGNNRHGLIIKVVFIQSHRGC